MPSCVSYRKEARIFSRPQIGNPLRIVRQANQGRGVSRYHPNQRSLRSNKSFRIRTGRASTLPIFFAPPPCPALLPRPVALCCCPVLLLCAVAPAPLLRAVAPLRSKHSGCAEKWTGAGGVKFTTTNPALTIGITGRSFDGTRLERRGNDAADLLDTGSLSAVCLGRFDGASGNVPTQSRSFRPRSVTGSVRRPPVVSLYCDAMLIDSPTERDEAGGDHATRTWTMDSR